jgi:transcriptional regulator with XRE-family HTH domain
MNLSSDSPHQLPAGDSPLADTAFGERLRLERERRRITLDSIAANTKIGLPLLQGLERGNVSRWPSGIFRRSFIRAYAEAIGLEPDEIAREFLERFPDPLELPRPVSLRPARPDIAGRQNTAGNRQDAAAKKKPPKASHAAPCECVLRLQLAEPGSIAAPGNLHAGVLARCAAVACDAGVLIAIGFMFYLAFNRFWMPFAIAVAAYYAGSILVLGNTPGVSLFLQATLHRQANGLLASVGALLRAVGSAIRHASARLSEVASR